tara:strand:- start:376 stop:1116 length:741 start_codon:yes stop_codon:yes gene_type:complete
MWNNTLTNSEGQTFRDYLGEDINEQDFNTKLDKLVNDMLRIETEKWGELRNISAEGYEHLPDHARGYAQFKPSALRVLANRAKVFAKNFASNVGIHQDNSRQQGKNAPFGFDQISNLEGFTWLKEYLPHKDKFTKKVFYKNQLMSPSDYTKATGYTEDNNPEDAGVFGDYANKEWKDINFHEEMSLEDQKNMLKINLFMGKNSWENMKNYFLAGSAEQPDAFVKVYHENHHQGNRLDTENVKKRLG